MDLATLVSDKRLLAQLSREYEVLKRSQAAVDYEAWIRKRLSEAALGVHAISHVPSTASAAAGASTSYSSMQPAALHQAQPDSGWLQQQQQEQQQQQQINARPPAQLELSRGGKLFSTQQTAAVDRHAAGADYDGAGGIQMEGGGQGGLQLSHRPEWQATDMTNAAGPQDAGDSSEQPGKRQPRPPGLWPAPEAYVTNRRPDDMAPRDALGRALRPKGSRPDWVSAASLHASLKSSRVVPLMHAAADRERRLAVSSALARQQLALGLDSMGRQATLQQQGQQHWQQWQRGVAGAGGCSAEVEHVVALAQQLAAQTAGLQEAMQRQGEQLAQQQVLLRQALGQQPALQASSGIEAAQLAAATAAAAAGNELPEAIRSSWLLRSVGLQQGKENASAPSHQSAEAQQTEWQARAYSSTATTSGQTGWQPAQQQQQQQQKREVTKQLLKQLLGSWGSGSGGADAAQLGALLQALLSRRQQHQQQHQPQPAGNADDLSNPGSLFAQLLAGMAQGSSAGVHQEWQQGQAGQQRRQQQQQQLPPRVAALRHLGAAARAAAAAAAADRDSASSPSPPRRGRPRWDDRAVSPALPRVLQRRLASKLDRSPSPPALPVRKKAQQRPDPRHPGQRRPALPSAKAPKRHMQPPAHEDLSSPDHEPRPRLLDDHEVAHLETRVAAQMQAEKQAEEERVRQQRLDDMEERVLRVMAQVEQRLAVTTAALAAQATPPAPAAAAPKAMPFDPETLRGVLSALEQMEGREREVRHRWLQPQVTHDEAGMAQAPPLLMTDGMPVPQRARFGQVQHDIPQAADDAAGPSNRDSTPQQANQQQQQQQRPPDVPEFVPDTLVKSVLRGRRHFLKHQRLLDGALAEGHDGSQPAPQPTQMVERVADMLIDDLLMAQAQELHSSCDVLVDHMFDAEFA